MTLKNAVFTSSGAPRDFAVGNRLRALPSARERRIWAALTRKGEPYGKSQFSAGPTSSQVTI